MNLLHGTPCPSVVCRRSGLAFEWQDAAGTWHQGDELPAEIARALPGPELTRCERHAWRRMVGRKGAA